jgi:hypothetical protein
MWLSLYPYDQSLGISAFAAGTVSTTTDATRIAAMNTITGNFDISIAIFPPHKRISPLLCQDLQK